MRATHSTPLLVSISISGCSVIFDPGNAEPGVSSESDAGASTVPPDDEPSYFCQPYSCDEATMALYHFDGASEGACEAPSPVTPTTSGRFGGSVWFLDQGTQAGIVATNSSALTVEAWLYPSYAAQENGAVTLVSPECTLKLSNGGMATANSASSGAVTVKGAAVPDECWGHVALVLAGSELSVYVDGLKEGPVQVPEGCHANQSWTVRLGDGFSGALDEVRVSDTARRFDPDTCAGRICGG